MDVGRSGAAVVLRTGRSGPMIGVETVQTGPVLPDEVLVARTVSGVSTGTDRWVLSGRFGWAELPPPLVPGYQAVGVVEECGADVTGFEPGQTVFVTTTRPWTDVAASWGGHARYGISPAAEVYQAEGIPAARAALTVTAQVGWNAASRLRAERGAPVVVIGDGIIGASGALAAVERGYAVTVVGRHADRLDLIATLGPATVLTTPDGDGGLREQLTMISPHAVIDTVQTRSAFDGYVETFAAGVVGQLVYSGHSPDGATAWADMARLQQLGLAVDFVSGWTRRRIETVLGRMRDGGMPVDRLVGATAHSADEATALMTDVAAGRHRALAAVIDWTLIDFDPEEDPA